MQGNDPRTWNRISCFLFPVSCFLYYSSRLLLLFIRIRLLPGARRAPYIGDYYTHL